MQIYSFYQDSVQPHSIHVEVHTRFQIPSFQILGLPAQEIQESRERIMAAFTASGFEFPKKRVIVNLAPSAVRKSGTGHDLPIALSVLESVLDFKWPEKAFAWGELGLDGEVKPSGKMATLLELLTDLDPWKRGQRFSTEETTLFLSTADAERIEALLEWRKEQGLCIPSRLIIHRLKTLQDIPKVLSGKSGERLKLSAQKLSIHSSTPHLPISLLPLHPQLKRVVEIAMVGRHHTLILGPKGIGKSQALTWFKSLNPPSLPEKSWTRLLHHETRTEFNQKENLNFETPIRQVHANVRPAHLLGSWSSKGFRAGELSLAHGGLLIADEFMEWPRDSKECLREPLQSKQVILTRVHGQVTFPCDIQMIATGNLCPCGGLPAQFMSAVKPKRIQRCKCRPPEVDHYFQKLSGPIADRLDLITIFSENEMPQKDLQAIEPLQEKIKNACEFSRHHYGTLAGDLQVTWLEKNLPADPGFEKLLQRVPNLRSRHKVLRIARSIQALEGSVGLKEEHVFEAMTYRFMEP